MDKQDKSIAVMQPYIFPYIGYFQLINAVDVFVFYDDVNYIKQGWVNRNRILDKNEPFYFTVPLKKASSFKAINETLINTQLYFKWKKKFIRSIKQSYSKAPYFKNIYKLINEILSHPNLISISDLATLSIISISKYLNLNVVFHKSSKSFSESQGIEKADRLINISKQLSAKTYINAIGGKDLYEKKYFEKHDINLFFLEPSIPLYKQFNEPHIKGLSIIDVLMFNSKEECKELLQNYQLE